MADRTVATLKLFGGHVALDFTNTVDSRGPRWGPDTLRSYADLLDWGIRLGVITAADAAPLRHTPDAPARSALGRAVRLREIIYRVFAERPAPPADLERLQQEVLWAQAARVLAAQPDSYTWAWQAPDPDTISRRIAIAAADLLTSPALQRVHVCPGENCGWLFLDTSRSGRRVWCSEETCGTRNRVRRWRARKGQAH